jgi:molecular chaperone GrpE
MSETSRKAQNAESADNDPFADPEAGLASKGNRRGGSSEQTGKGEPTDTDAATETLVQVKQERDELKEQVLRARAEFANYQKRAKQQADADRAYAVGSLARDLLEPLDNLERAIDALRATAAQNMTAGLDMVQRQILDILAKHGVELIPAQGLPFDPNLHDAVMQQPSHEHPAGTVVSELAKGYTIRDRVLRPSKVAVSTKPTVD